jgi:hypothetical protein
MSKVSVAALVVEEKSTTSEAILTVSLDALIKAFVFELL